MKCPEDHTYRVDAVAPVERLCTRITTGSIGIGHTNEITAAAECHVLNSCAAVKNNRDTSNVLAIPNADTIAIAGKLNKANSARGSDLGRRRPAIA